MMNYEWYSISAALLRSPRKRTTLFTSDQTVCAGGKSKEGKRLKQRTWDERGVGIWGRRIKKTILQPRVKNNLVYFRSDCLCRRKKQRGKETHTKNMRWERGENLREEDEQNYSAARGKEQPCLLQLRLSVREDKKKRGKEIKKWEGWEFEKEKDEAEVKKASDGKEGSALSLDSCKIPPLPLQQTPTRALFSTILWKHK